MIFRFHGKVSSVKVKSITNIIYALVGSALYAISVNVFSVPNGIVQGGLTGVATMLNKLFPFIPVGTAIFVMNVPLFIAAQRKISFAFVLKSIAATAAVTVLIDLGSLFLPAYEGDKLLASLFCGAVSGTGLALIFLAGATTGGTDIVAVLVRLKLPHISIGRIILFVDVIIVSLSWAVYGYIENIMYAFVALFISSRVVDMVIYGSDHGKLIFTVSEKSAEIAKRIMSEAGRGVSLIPVTGGYTGKDKKILLCAVRANEAKKINSIIKETDVKAFSVICDAGEIIGEGFK